MIFKILIFIGTAGSIFGAIIAFCTLLIPAFSSMMVEQDMKKDILQGAWRTVADFKPYFLVFAQMNPVSTVGHFVAAFSWMVGTSLQLTPSIRHKHKTFHHWCGYATLISGLTLVLSGSLMIFEGMYTAPFSETILNLRLAFISFGVLFSYCLVNAFINARKRDLLQHQKFVIRSVFLGFTGCYARIIALLVFNANNMQTFGYKIPKYGTSEGAALERLVFGWSEWVSLASMICVAELYIMIKLSNSAVRQTILKK